MKYKGLERLDSLDWLEAQRCGEHVQEVTHWPLDAEGPVLRPYQLGPRHPLRWGMRRGWWTCGTVRHAYLTNWLCTYSYCSSFASSSFLGHSIYCMKSSHCRLLPFLTNNWYLLCYDWVILSFFTQGSLSVKFSSLSGRHYLLAGYFKEWSFSSSHGWQTSWFLFLLLVVVTSLLSAYLLK